MNGSASALDVSVLLLLALAGVAGGACESALLSLSRSRLRDLLSARYADAPAPSALTRLAEGDGMARLSAAMLHSLAMGGFVLCGGRTGLKLFSGVNGARGVDLTLWLAGLLTALVGLRAVSALAGGMAPERMVLTLWRPVWLLILPFRPLARFFLWLERLAARGVGIEWDDEEERREDKLIAAVSDGALDGVVGEGQRDMIAGVFDMKDADVADIFTPRIRMAAVDASASLEEAVRVGLDSGHSRLPVYEGTRDHIVGVFHLRDALEYWNRPAPERPTLSELLHKPAFVPETKKVSELLGEMQRDQNHLAVVIDEYGGTAGLVTIEDVLEEIVGEIRDEYDREEGGAPVRPAGPDAWVAEGAAHVSEVNEAFGVDLIPEDDDYETVAGFVLARLGHIPAAGESFVWETDKGGARLSVKVLTADERRVGRVSVRRLPPGEA